MQITKVRIDKIHPNKYNPNVVPADTLAKLRAEIAQQGLCEPIQVRFSPDGYEIVDGEHRWRICRDLGFQEPAPCVLKSGVVQDFLKKPKLHTVYGIRDRAIFELFYSAGLRSQELRDLKLEDLDLSQRVLTVREGKGGKGRLVPFGRKAKEAVEEYINKSRTILNKKSGTYLFLTDQGNPMSAYILRHNMNRYRDPENRTATPHSFRHACALHMLRAGAGIRHLQQMLGHERITTTTIYTRLNPEDLKKAVKTYHPRELPPKDEK